MTAIRIPQVEFFAAEIDQLEESQKGPGLPVTGDEETQALIRKELDEVAAENQKRLAGLWKMREELTTVNATALRILLACFQEGANGPQWVPCYPEDTILTAYNELYANEDGWFNPEVADILTEAAGLIVAAYCRPRHSDL